jgi:hypothetical protein
MTRIIFMLITFSFTLAYANNMDKLREQLQKAAAEHQAKLGQKRSVASTPAIPPAPVCDASIRNGICYSFTGSQHADSKTARGNEMACKMLRGKLVAASTCPEKRLLGRCRVSAGDPKEYILHYYSSGRLNKAKAEQDCANPKSSIHAQGAGQWF